MKKKTAAKKPKIRDRQRSRVYKWEQVAAFPSAYKTDTPKLTLAECQLLVNKVWRDHETTRHTPPKVRDGRGRRHPAAQGDAIIKLPRWSRCAEIVLHEIAHSLLHNYMQKQGVLFEPHGAEFVGLFIDLVCKYHGADRKVLTDSAQQSGVRFTDFHLPQISTVEAKSTQNTRQLSLWPF